MNPAVGVGETSEFAIAAMQSNSFDRHSLGLAISLPFHQGRVWVNLWTTTLLPLIIISNLIPVDIFSFSLMKYVSVWNLVKRMLINWAEQCTKFLESIAEIHVNIDATSWLLLRHSLKMMFFTWVKSFTLNLKSFTPKTAKLVIFWVPTWSMRSEPEKGDAGFQGDCWQIVCIRYCGSITKGVPQQSSSCGIPQSKKLPPLNCKGSTDQATDRFVSVVILLPLIAFWRGHYHRREFVSVLCSYWTNSTQYCLLPMEF